MSDIVEAKIVPDMDLASIFQELGDECRVSVKREEPEWCMGHIRTVAFNPDKPIDMDWLRTKFGGEKLQVRLYGPHKTKENRSGYITSRLVDIMGPPCDGHGIELTQGPDGKACRVTELQTVIERHNQKMGIKRQSESVQPVASPALQNETLFATMIQAQAQQHGAMMEMMGQRVNSLEGILYKRGPDQQGTPANPIDQIKQTAEAMKILKSMSGEYGDSAGSDDSSILSMIGPIIQGMFANKNNQQPAPRGVLKAASPARVIAGPQKNGTESIDSLVNNLASLSANDAAKVVFNVMGNMPPDKRDESMKAFMTMGSNMESDIDESLNEDNTNSQGVEEFTDPFACSESDSLPGQGRPLNENAPNDQANRTGDPAGI